MNSSELKDDNTKLKLILSSSYNPKENGISYSKDRKISFSAKGLYFTNISVLKSVQLAFFEKYIILLLQKGIKASSRKEDSFDWMWWSW